MLAIGCRLSCAKGYANMTREAASIDADTFRFFTRNPRGGCDEPRSAARDQRTKAAMFSMCGVWGNMSTGWRRSIR